MSAPRCRSPWANIASLRMSQSHGMEYQLHRSQTVLLTFKPARKLRVFHNSLRVTEAEEDGLVLGVRPPMIPGMFWGLIKITEQEAMRLYPMQGQPTPYWRTGPDEVTFWPTPNADFEVIRLCLEQTAQTTSS